MILFKILVLIGSCCYGMTMREVSNSVLWGTVLGDKHYSIGFSNYMYRKLDRDSDRLEYTKDMDYINVSIPCYGQMYEIFLCRNALKLNISLVSLSGFSNDSIEFVGKGTVESSKLDLWKRHYFPEDDKKPTIGTYSSSASKGYSISHKEMNLRCGPFFFREESPYSIWLFGTIGGASEMFKSKDSLEDTKIFKYGFENLILEDLGFLNYATKDSKNIIFELFDKADIKNAYSPEMSYSILEGCKAKSFYWGIGCRIFIGKGSVKSSFSVSAMIEKLSVDMLLIENDGKQPEKNANLKMQKPFSGLVRYELCLEANVLKESCVGIGLFGNAHGIKDGAFIGANKKYLLLSPDIFSFHINDAFAVLYVLIIL